MYTENHMKFWPRKKYITARAIIIQDGNLLVFRRKRVDLLGKPFEYFSIPGGQIDKGEQADAAAVRELKEEMGVDISLHGLVAHYKGAIFEHYVFSASIDKGTPHFMSDSEEATMYLNENNQYEVVWIPVSNLSKENLKFYGMFYDHIQALADGKAVVEVRNIKLSKHVY